jgi:phosphohistidine phosphatase
MGMDFERGLTSSGRKEIKEIANSIKALKLEIDKIATSPLIRAQETSEIFAKALKKQKGSRSLGRVETRS